MAAQPRSSIVPGPDLETNFTVDLSAVQAGFHILYVRARDAQGQWSLTYAKPFLQESVSPADQPPNLVALEYYIDTDPGYGQAVAVPIGSGNDLSQSFTVDLSGLDNGYHMLYVRYPGCPGPVEPGPFQAFLPGTRTSG